MDTVKRCLESIIAGFGSTRSLGDWGEGEVKEDALVCGLGPWAGSGSIQRSTYLSRMISPGSNVK